MHTVSHRPPAGHADAPHWRYAAPPTATRSQITDRLWNALRRAVEADADAGALARAAAADPADTLRYAVLADLLDERPLALTRPCRWVAPWWPDARGELAARLAAALRWCHAGGKFPAFVPRDWSP